MLFVIITLLRNTTLTVYRRVGTSTTCAPMKHDEVYIPATFSKLGKHSSQLEHYQPDKCEIQNGYTAMERKSK